MACTPHIQQAVNLVSRGHVKFSAAAMAMHKVFISYHHTNDQQYKEELVEFGQRYSIFVDRSVDTGDIPDTWTDE